MERTSLEAVKKMGASRPHRVLRENAAESTHRKKRLDGDTQPAIMAFPFLRTALPTAALRHDAPGEVVPEEIL
jgi:hypothetical protein